MIGKEDNFQIETTALTFNTKYDYGSILHYRRTEASSNKLDTITPKVFIISLEILDFCYTSTVSRILLLKLVSVQL